MNLRGVAGRRGRMCLISKYRHADCTSPSPHLIVPRTLASQNRHSQCCTSPLSAIAHTPNVEAIENNSQVTGAPFCVVPCVTLVLARQGLRRTVLPSCIRLMAIGCDPLGWSSVDISLHRTKRARVHGCDARILRTVTYSRKQNFCMSAKVQKMAVSVPECVQLRTLGSRT